jgi:hypothetical protein
MDATPRSTSAAWPIVSRLTSTYGIRTNIERASSRILFLRTARRCFARSRFLLSINFPMGGQPAFLTMSRNEAREMV